MLQVSRLSRSFRAHEVFSEVTSVIEGREHFEAALDAFEGTVIAVAHDRRFLARFAERVIDVREGRVSIREGGYA